MRGIKHIKCDKNTYRLVYGRPAGMEGRRRRMVETFRGSLKDAERRQGEILTQIEGRGMRLAR